MIYTTLKPGARWPYVIAISKEVPRGGMLKRVIRDTPLAIHRDNIGDIYAFLDVCPHKKGILGINKKTITCQYHGWQFDNSGIPKYIPSITPEETWPKCHLSAIRSEEKYGFIWIYEDPISLESIPTFIAPNLPGWGHTYTQESFETTEELLIANFMDATHTPIVHNGIIRSNQANRQQRSIRIQTTTHGVDAHFTGGTESIGLGVSKLLNKYFDIEHTDRYIAPNIVQVIYSLNGVSRFEAIIGCSSQTIGHTYAFLKISYRFGIIVNLIIKLFLPLISKIVLLQDKAITKSQYINTQRFSYMPEHLLKYDLLHTRVRAYKAAIEANKEIKPQKDIHLSIKL